MTLEQLSAGLSAKAHVTENHHGNTWSATVYFGEGDEARDAMRMFADVVRTGQLVAAQPEQPTCMLCAGKCRGHSLADSKAWEPEPGSQAFAVLLDDATVERAKWALKNASRGGLSEELCGLYVREVLAALAKGPKA